MPTTVLLGCQWGDEGKATVIDYLSSKFDYVIRFQGGGNAGHTVIVGDKKYILHYVPSGIIHPKTNCVIANGVVLSLEGLCEEMEELKQQSISFQNRFFISDRCHIVLPFHFLLDGAREDKQNRLKIGTTRKGISPTYSDKAAHIGLRISDLYSNQRKQRLEEVVQEKNFLLSQFYNKSTVNYHKILDELDTYKKQLEPYICDTLSLLHKAYAEDKHLLLEGAQGTLLDIDFGTYPYVTSSNSSVGGACTGTGLPPSKIDQVIGVFKTYVTRVGEGPLPTEVHGEQGDQLRALGHEYGSTTGRPRRCGWFDLVAAKYTAQINGVTHLIITKLDILDAYDEIPVCIEYKYKGSTCASFPALLDQIYEIEPVYTQLPGWKQSTAGIKEFSQLPKNAQAFVQFLEQELALPFIGISTGPERQEMIWRME